LARTVTPGKPCGCSPVTASNGQHPGAACTTTAPWPSCRGGPT